jgi:signal transduction histidine kinase
MTTRTRRRLIAAIVIASLCWSVVAAWLLNTSSHLHSDTGGLAEDAVGLGFMFGGVIAWDRRPDNRVGPLLCLVGAGWMGQALVATSNGWVFALGYVSYAIFFGSICTLLVVFPTGQPDSRAARILIVMGWAEGILFPLSLFFLQPRQSATCKECPDTPLRVVDNQWVTDLFAALPTLLGLVLGPGVVAYLVVKWRRSSPSRRRALAPVAIAGALAASTFLATLVLIRFLPQSRAVASTGSQLALLTVPVGFLIGLLREQLFRSSALGGIVPTLAEALTPSDVEAALAAALRDPGLVVGFWIGERGIYVDAEGRPLPEDPGRAAETVVEREGRRIAIIRHDPVLSEDPPLLSSVSAAAALALDRSRLEAELRLRLAELAASRARLVSASDAARRRIERDLHDGAQQRLVGLALRLRLACATADDPDAVRRELDECASELTLALDELRELARGIHPAILTERGLQPAIAALADRAPIPVEAHLDVPDRLPPPVEAALYFVAAEALTNVAKYAHASRVTIAAGVDERGVVAVAICDDGVGGADPESGTGLRGLRDRLDAVGGDLDVSSTAAGTTVTARVPVAAEASS